MRRKTRRHEVALVLLIALIIGVVASILWADRVAAAKQAELDDLNIFLDASSAGWAEATNQFFAQSESAAKAVSALAPHSATTAEQVVLLAESIRAVPSLDAAFIGFVDGAFVFVGRPDDDTVPPDGFRTRVISTTGGNRTLELAWTDTNLNIVRSEVDPTDLYDPRVRPWFAPIAAGAEHAWTDPYIFASIQQPGITHSVAIRDESGELLAVVGVDTRLTQLSKFLDEVRPGDRGEALVIDGEGRVIAASSVNGGKAIAPEDLASEQLDQNPALVKLVASLASGDVDGAFALADDGTWTSIARPVGTGNDWYLAIRAYNSDFLGGVWTDPPKTLFDIGAVGFAAATIVGLLGFGALRTLDRLRDDATHDELTGLLNRRAVTNAITSMLSSGSKLSVAIVDLDRFKEVNDHFGHLTGDAVLTALAARIATFASDGGAIAGRLGGDEFVIVHEGEMAWQPLIGRLQDSVIVDGNRFNVGGSIGVAVSSPNGGRTTESLLRAADRAMFEVKRAGGGAVGVREAR